MSKIYKFDIGDTVMLHDLHYDYQNQFWINRSTKCFIFSQTGRTNSKKYNVFGSKSLSGWELERDWREESLLTTRVVLVEKICFACSSIKIML